MTGSSPADLGSQVAQGVRWGLSCKFLERVLYLGASLVTARLLTPDDFGLMGIVMAVIAGVEVFSGLNLDSALIQKKERTEEYLGTLWTVQALRGALLCLLVLGSAGWVGEYFGRASLGGLLRVTAILFVLRGATHVNILYFRKELRFSRDYLLQLGKTVAQLAVAVAFAWWLGSVWALVGGQLAGTAARMILSYFMCPGKPACDFDRERFRELFAFGKWIFLTNLLLFLVNRGSSLLVGKMFGAEDLGYYGMALLLAGMPATELGKIISQAIFPAWARMQDEPVRLKQAYLHALRISSLLIFPAAGWIYVAGGDFVVLSLGEPWAPVAPLLKILAVFGAGRAVVQIGMALNLGVGRADLNTKIPLVEFLVMAVAIYPLAREFGMAGVAWAVVLPLPFYFAYALVTLLPLLHCTWREWGRSIYPATVAAGAALAVTAWIGAGWRESPRATRFLAETAVFVGVFLGAGGMVVGGSGCREMGKYLGVPRAPAARRGWRVGLLTTMATLALLWGIGELCLLRRIPFVIRRYPRVFRPGVGMQLPPGAAVWSTNGIDYWIRERANSLGFMDRDHAFPKPPGCFRILVLGDSFVEALQVPREKKFPVLLEGELRRRNPGRACEVMALGFGGAGTSQELSLYEQYGRRYAPDLVLLVFTANDFANNSLLLSAIRHGWNPDHPPWRFYERGGPGGEIRRLDPDPDWERAAPGILGRYPWPLLADYALSYSRVYLWLRMRSEFLFNLPDRALTGEFRRRVARLKDRPEFRARLESLREEDYREDSDFPACPGPGIYAEALEVTRQVLGLFRRAAEQDRFRLLVVAGDDCSLGRNWSARRDRFRHLAGLAVQEGIPLLDLYPALSRTGDIARMRFSHDGHWNERGHARVAQALAEACEFPDRREEAPSDSTPPGP